MFFGGVLGNVDRDPSCPRGLQESSDLHKDFDDIGHEGLVGKIFLEVHDKMCANGPNNLFKPTASENHVESNLVAHCYGWDELRKCGVRPLVLGVIKSGLCLAAAFKSVPDEKELRQLPGFHLLFQSSKKECIVIMFTDIESLKMSQLILSQHANVQSVKILGLESPQVSLIVTKMI